MNDATRFSAHALQQDSDDATSGALCEADLISDDDIDYAAIARSTHPDQPGGRIIFDSGDYPTEEAAMAAMELLFLGDTEEEDDEINPQG